MSTTSTRQRINCFIQALPSFQTNHKRYLASMKQGIRPKKQSKNN